jgi:hypothetical protein
VSLMPAKSLPSGDAPCVSRSLKAPASTVT